MANRIKGITIEIGGDTTKLDKALSSVNKTISTTQSQLNDVNKLLKLDPSNTELVAQKQRLLTEQISNTKEKLEQLQTAAKAASEALAKGEINQSQYDAIQREIVETENNLKSLGDQLDDTNTKWEGWGEVAEKAGKVAKVAAEACAAAVVAAGTAVVKVVKDATESYAEYEQLVGGVDTLFKESSSIVQEYAQNAYKTAGMSANEYMETVTSFSASLLQGLEGDTAEAAKVADMAISDMSDNANKMGTDISSIQNAYQGFAKQNYTMLDNLKLGYGGTKTEMERLLADAEEFSGIKYDINNLNDVYEAIHVIQEEMGITGTTAKEASTTIQGSMSALKASWENALVAMTDENGDLEGSIDALVESATTVISNLLPVIQRALTGIVEAINVLAPEIIAMLPGLIEEILPPLLDAVMEIVKAIAEVAPDLITTIVSTLLEYLPELIECAVTLFTALTEGLTDSIPQLIPVMLDAILTMIDALIDNIPLLLSAAGELIGGLATGLVLNLPKIVTTAGKILGKIKDVFKPSNAIEWGKDLLSGLIKGITDKIDDVKKAAKSVAESISSFLHFSRPEEGPLHYYEEWMPDFIEGMAKGIEKNKHKLTDAVQGMSAEMTMSPSSGITNSLGNIQTLLSQGNVIVLDTGELVGATAKSYNAELGNIARLEAVR